MVDINNESDTMGLFTSLLRRWNAVLHARRARRCGYEAHRSARIAKSAVFKRAKGGRIVIGMDSSIAEGVVLDTQGGAITLGRNVSINPYCVLLGKGGISIGDNVRIAPQVGMAASQHVFADPAAPIRTQGSTRRGIVIENDVWLGMGAKILDGVTIARGCVVGAGAVVTRSTEPFGIYTGVPARRVGTRGHEASQPLVSQPLVSHHLTAAAAAPGAITPAPAQPNVSAFRVARPAYRSH